jgi:hypothetical protein
VATNRFCMWKDTEGMIYDIFKLYVVLQILGLPEVIFAITDVQKITVIQGSVFSYLKYLVWNRQGFLTGCEDTCWCPLWARLIHSTPCVCHRSVLLFTHLCLDLQGFSHREKECSKICMQNVCHFLNDIVS